MATLIGMAGSLRVGSFNAALLRAAATLMPQGSRLDTADIRGIPLYDGDVETTQGIPPAVAALKDRIAAADGLILATPEYNNALPGVFKNAIDWLSRPPGDISRVFGNRPVAVIGASPSNFGTILAQNSWLPVLRVLGTQPWFTGRLMVPRAGSMFNEQGELLDEKVRTQLQQFMHGFVDFVQLQCTAGNTRQR
ncbi:MAG: NADPH-dependent FMN reductase [Burkholderiales bacterium RIFCSPLOWO2_12_FULL_61_40]|nr:MAG: NADPH-dependent FMN reductase [Burkholderiales bacterium RIFCSPLOWO2_12_FULL_61_40]